MRRGTVEDKKKLNLRFTLAWVIWMALLLFAEFMSFAVYGDQWDEKLAIVRALALVSFLVIEILAIREGFRFGGTTFTHHVRMFYAGKPARIPFIVGLCLYFMFTIIEPDIMLWGVSLSRMSLGVGLTMWLIPHFIGRGKWG